MSEKDADRQTGTDAAGDPPAEDHGAGESDLDSLLREFEQDQEPESGKPDADKHAKPKSKQPSRAATTDDLGPVIDFARGEMTRRVEEEMKADLNKAMSFLKEADELQSAPDRILRGLAEAYAQEEPNFGKAFQQRKNNPKVWSKALGDARNWIIGAVKEWPGNNVRSDIEAAVTSARKTSTKQPDPDRPSVSKMAKMSDQEWMEYLSDLRQEAAQP